MIIGNSFEEVFTEEVQQKARQVNPSSFPPLRPLPPPPIFSWCLLRACLDCFKRSN